MGGEKKAPIYLISQEMTSALNPSEGNTFIAKHGDLSMEI